ncbi:recombinase family protein [Homoserinimonas sp. OAct 916]|uniref:recombinase family protein n=1 Tax=Homoserinimonas sp. OAct 916 TaxID=2211450 RepID=UPI0018E551AD|nr:recombinase family protein [Homoserinimonas sp. OAct 916]
MPITQPPAIASLDRFGETTTFAVSYLRVSTKEQAERGGRDEGFSIPAQREANLRKARDLNAVVIEEFVDAGESARKADRPELVRMIEYVKTNEIAYCIVHKVDRLARNRADDVAIHLALKEAGVMLVSATENIDETPSGMLLHGIMSTIAEFYSRNLANEVSKGMNQKAVTGGTNGKAPVGYLNITTRDELGRELRTVQPDPDRAPMVKWAFEAYATGNYSTSSLHEALVDRGLTTVPTPKRPTKPPALSTIQKMLANPYYKGNVSFRGATYEGMHEPLISPEIWYRVRSVLTAKQTSGEKTQAHDHYLKGTVYCRQCGSRLMVTNAKSRSGTIYPYFICAGRHAKRTNCEQKSMFIPDVEIAVEDYYRRIQIPEHVVSALRTFITAQFDQLHVTAKQERHAHGLERDDLLAERSKLLQAHYAGAVPLDLLKTEQDRIARRLAFLNAQVESGDIEYEQAKAHLDDCLALAGDCHQLHMSIDDSLRRIANQAFFSKIYLSEEGTIDGEPGEPFTVFFNPDVQSTAARHERRPVNS